MGILDVPALTRAQADARYPRPRGTRTIIFGDSVDADVRGWYPYWSIGTKRVETMRNAAIGGNTTAQMLARLQTDVLAYGPDVVIVGGGTNDHGQGVAQATLRANIIEIVAGVRAAGATPILRTELPVDIAGTGPYNSIALRREAILTHNAWLYDFTSREGLDLLDVYQACVDATTGGYTSGYTSDGVHPVEVGAKAIATSLLAQPLPASVNRGRFPFARAVTDPANLLVNGVFVGDTNADGLADGWVVNGAPTCTLTPAAPGDGITGNWQRITTSDATARSGMQDINLSGGNLAEGDIVQIVGRVRTSGGTAALVRLTPYSNGSPITGIDAVQDMTQAIDGVFSTRMALPTGPTRIRILVQVKTAAGWIEVAEFAARNLTKLVA